jgi:hypothetical protein
MSFPASKLADSDCRMTVLVNSIIGVIIWVSLFLMWTPFGILNFLPLFTWGYGFVWNVLVILSSVMGLFLFIVDLKIYLYFTTMAIIIVFVLTCFALAVSIYTVYACYVLSLPSGSCTTFTPTYIIVAILNLVLFFSVLISFFKILQLMRMYLPAVSIRNGVIRTT